MWFFTSDEHYGHRNIIKYCSRPYESVEEMDADLIIRHNAVVRPDDVVVHGGDFTLKKKPEQAREYIRQLNGKHIFLKGGHDYWQKGKQYDQIWEKNIDGAFIVVCHYAMRVWARSHYNSWHLFGHSHGNLEPEGKSWDIGVDNNHYYPVSFDQVKEIMAERPDNFNLIREEDRR